jgi:hypothetical protein
MSQTTPRAPDALIYLPGLGSRGQDAFSISAVAAQLAHSLDVQAVDVGAHFSIGRLREEKFREFTTPVVSIMREAKGAEPTNVADMYLFDYRSLLISKSQQAAPLQEIFTLFAIICSGLLRLVGSFFRGHFRKRSSLMVLLGSASMAIFLVYAVMTLPAVIGVVLRLLGGYDGEGRDSVAAVASSVQSWVVLERLTSWSQSLIVTFTALGLLTRFNLKQFINESAGELDAVTRYLTLHDQRPELLGRFTTLLEHLAERCAAGEYQRIHVLGYSFGSIVALDALFPAEAAPVPRTSSIETLVTIGCPFDFIKLYWPKYFDFRKIAPAEQRAKWINLHSDTDLLSSSFAQEGLRSDVKKGDRGAKPDLNVMYSGTPRDEKLNLMERLLVSFTVKRHHLSYWGSGKAHDQGCLMEVVRHVELGEPMVGAR